MLNLRPPDILSDVDSGDNTIRTFSDNQRIPKQNEFA